jgi:hypothetical protein
MAAKGGGFTREKENEKQDRLDNSHRSDAVPTHRRRTGPGGGGFETGR